MSRLIMPPESQTEKVLRELYGIVLRRVASGASLLCPVDMVTAFLKLCHAQSCGKCVPCRIGLGQLIDMLEDVLDGNATNATVALIEKTARSIYASADCAIGFGAAEMVLRGLEGFREDYIAHVRDKRCSVQCEQGAPCISLCPAGVEIPGYIALIAEGQYADAIRLIRRDNPFPTVCGYVCEHPCEAKCRRHILDDAINIRGLKRFAADNAGYVPPPKKYPETGKRVAIIGAGPAGLTAAYYLALMGHTVEVFEKRGQLGGMLRYGIPRYRLPSDKLDNDIRAILDTGIKVHTGMEVGRDVSIDTLRKEYDAIFISIGAHTDKKLQIPGTKGPGVIPAIEMLRDLGEGVHRDFAGKTVNVIGGGNVAMDAARSAMRLGARRVNIVYRRRQQDMTALPEEVEGAIAEGCDLITLCAPHSIERNAEGNIKALWVQPQLAGPIVDGRPLPIDAAEPRHRIPCDLIIVAIGQAIESENFGKARIPLDRDAICAGGDSSVLDHPGIFAGGDCVTGPATVIKAIAAGKVAAANIDEYLGFHHPIKADVDIPAPGMIKTEAWGRANMVEREAAVRKQDFEMIEEPLSGEAACLEASRCLRCDHYGYGTYWADRRRKW
ncbi:MAG: NAD(P)-binding protein [Oscillospiraceae bacterium]